MMMNQQIFKIVKIPSNSSVVINGGINHSLQEGDLLEVFVVGDPVKDPETGEDLGTLDYIKANLEVVQVYPKMSVCKNADTHKEPSPFSAFSTFTKERSVRNSLNLNENEISGEFAHQDSTIRIGDTVRIKEKTR